MLNRIGMGIGAGLASALLFVVTVQGTALALALAYLAPLPIMIATLGWGVDAGLVALCAACAVVAGAIEVFSGVLFGLTVALPAWGLAAFACLRGSPWRLDSYRRPLVASAPLRPSAAPSDSDRLCAGSVDITSVRSPDAAHARAVEAATDVLPTPPLPV